MYKEFICFVNMFHLNHKIFAIDENGNGSTETGPGEFCNIDNMADKCIELCIANNVNKVHLFCDNPEYVTPVVQEIKEYCVRHNAANLIEVEVN